LHSAVVVFTDVNIYAIASGPADVAAHDAPVASALLLTLLLAMLLYGCRKRSLFPS
jgi:hypothetical protein